MRRGIATGVVVALVALAGCGGGEEESDTPSPGEVAEQQEPADSPAPTSKYADDDPEALLATIDNDGDNPPDADLDPYAARLDAIERVGRESRSLRADQVANGQKLLKSEKNLDYSAAQVARAYTNALTKQAGTDQKCAELFAAVLTATTAEE